MLYLSGFEEPESIFTLEVKNNQLKASLFCQKEVGKHVHFHGTNIGPERAKLFFHMDNTFEIDQFEDYLKTQTFKTIYIDRDENSFWPCDTDLKFRDIKPFLHRLRAIKSADELSIMRKAAKAAYAGFNEVLKTLRPGIEESVLSTSMEYGSKIAGAQHLAYTPVVGGGSNALVIHYVKNRQRLADGDLVLMDAGALMNHYRSDITRTFPVNGRFSEAQKELYGAVLRTHQKCLEVRDSFIYLVFKIG